MRTTVGRTYRFRATHALPGFPEPWCFPHQHDYTIEVEMDGGVGTDDLDEQWERTPQMDEIVELTTVENLATVYLDAMPLATRVTVWEDRQRWGRAER